MNQRIIYPNDEGGVSIIIPAIDCGLTIEQIAFKDVPAGKPWRILEDSMLPPRESRNLWLWTDSGPLALA